jgi:hypothetical protein
VIGDGSRSLIALPAGVFAGVGLLAVEAGRANGCRRIAGLAVGAEEERACCSAAMRGVRLLSCTTSLWASTKAASSATHACMVTGMLGDLSARDSRTGPRKSSSFSTASQPVGIGVQSMSASRSMLCIGVKPPAGMGAGV